MFATDLTLLLFMYTFGFYKKNKPQTIQKYMDSVKDQKIKILYKDIKLKYEIFFSLTLIAYLCDRRPYLSFVEYYSV